MPNYLQYSIKEENTLYTMYKIKPTEIIEKKNNCTRVTKQFA
jgi:hypothetical protein